MSSPFLAEMRITGFNFPPQGWALCDGQLLPINQNQALFSLLGTTYGGNGVVNFALPDMRGRAPVHPGTEKIQGQRAGEESHALTLAEIPAHTHALTASIGGGVQDPGSNALPGTNFQPLYSGTVANTVAMGASAVSTAGGSQAHSNLQPYLVVSFIIALVGIFPSRN